jgi:hypothetical protein
VRDYLRTDTVLLLRYVLRTLLSLGVAVGTVILLTILGAILGGNCEPSEKSDGMTPCIDFPDGWHLLIWAATLILVVLTWIGTRFITHGLWKPPPVDSN